MIAKIKPTKIQISFGKSLPNSDEKKCLPDITPSSKNQMDKNAAFKIKKVSLLCVNVNILKAITIETTKKLTANGSLYTLTFNLFNKNSGSL